MEQIPQPPRPRSGTFTVLRVWLWGTGIALVAGLIWTIAPVLFLLLALTVLLGLLSAVMVKLARLLEAWKNGRTPRPPETERH